MKVEGDRILAILIIDGEIFISDINHQECLFEYKSKHGGKQGYSCSYEEVVDETYAMKCNHTAWGFDVFAQNGKHILLGHDKQTLENNTEFAYKFVQEHKEDALIWEIGYFTDNWEYEAVSVIKNDEYARMLAGF